jgi:hypothetical protein
MIEVVLYAVSAVFGAIGAGLFFVVIAGNLLTLRDLKRQDETETPTRC